MHCIPALLLLSAGLAVAAPATTPNLSKRYLPTSNCGLGNYAKITESRVVDDVYSLYQKADTGEQIAAIVGASNTIACKGHTGVYLNVDQGISGAVLGLKTFDPSTLAAEVESTYEDCYGGKPHQVGDSNFQYAFQYWGEGYNILVQGNDPCE